MRIRQRPPFGLSQHIINGGAHPSIQQLNFLIHRPKKTHTQREEIGWQYPPENFSVRNFTKFLKRWQPPVLSCSYIFFSNVPSFSRLPHLACKLHSIQNWGYVSDAGSVSGLLSMPHFLGIKPFFSSGFAGLLIRLTIITVLLWFFLPSVLVKCHLCCLFHFFARLLLVLDLTVRKTDTSYCSPYILTNDPGREPTCPSLKATTIIFSSSSRRLCFPAV